MQHLIRNLLIGVVPVLVIACGNGGVNHSLGTRPESTGSTGGSNLSPAPTRTGSITGSTKEARKLFSALCAQCHGATGKGDGLGGLALDPKPRDLSLADWQTSVTDSDIKTVILRGGAAVGKSPSMPAQPQLKSKPKVLKALVSHIREFAK